MDSATCRSLMLICALLVGGESKFVKGIFEKLGQLAKSSEPSQELLYWSVNVVPGAAGSRPSLGGYEHHPGLGHYKVHDYSSSWCMANAMCQEEGAQLLVLNSEIEAEVAVKMMSKYPTAPDYFWVGVNEKGKHGEFFTIHGEFLHSSGFTRWVVNNPSMPGPNECVAIHRLTAGLVDSKCETSYRFICEYPE